MNQSGTYFTPRRLIQTIDPACGTGSFLLRVHECIWEVTNPPFGKTDAGYEIGPATGLCDRDQLTNEKAGR
ncbi:MAG: hypothetical protein DIJKHBIC_02326 [Thermoanaerobaculia bacterium]|nr:hypothetical protein [Thermoanaerobaculia bacterium]